MRGIALHTSLWLGLVLTLFPFYWMIVMATNTTEDTRRYPPEFTIGPEFLANIGRVFERIDFLGALVNTIIVAVSVTFLVLFFDSLAAFTFAKFEFPGKRFLFATLIGTYLLPVQLAVIPQFIVMVKLGWVGSFKALIVPAAANAFGIFWMRQYIQNAVQDDVLAAARLDGCGFFRQYLYMAVPMIRPGLAFLGIFTFVASWNDYIWPLVVFSQPDRTTLQVALAKLNAAYAIDFSMLMAGSLLAIVPLILIFMVFARNFVRDIAKGAVEG